MNRKKLWLYKKRITPLARKSLAHKSGALLHIAAVMGYDKSMTDLRQPQRLGRDRAHTSKKSSLNRGEYPSLSKYSEMDTSSSSLNTRTADTLKRAISNSIRHKLGSKMLPSPRNVLFKLSEDHTTPSPPCETLSVDLTSIDSTVPLCCRNRLKLVYVTGLKRICERRAVRSW